LTPTYFIIRSRKGHLGASVKWLHASPCQSLVQQVGTALHLLLKCRFP